MRGAATAERRRTEDGFTLIEALVAMVVLIFGLMAVTNLLLVAASSNAVANQGTAAASSATRGMDMLRLTSFADLLTVVGLGPDFSTHDGAGKDCNDPSLRFDDWHCSVSLQGVGLIHTHWWIEETDLSPLLYIRVQSEGVGTLAGRRSRADFTTFRACSDQDPGSPCPVL